MHLFLHPSPALFPSWHSSPWPPLPPVCHPQHPPLPGMGQLWGIALPGMPTQTTGPSPACISSAHLSPTPSPGPLVIGALVGCTSVVSGLDIGGITGVKGECLAQLGAWWACPGPRPQVRVLELENQLQKERQKLGELRKKHYELAGVAEGWEEDGEWSQPCSSWAAAP